MFFYQKFLVPNIFTITITTITTTTTTLMGFDIIKINLVIVVLVVVVADMVKVGSRQALLVDIFEKIVYIFG